MVWFKVDDSLHSHPKAMVASLAAVGLWSVSGSWSGGHLTDGFIPDHMIPSLSRGQTELAEELVAAGLWRRCKGGYRFHQWHEDGDGTMRNPSKEEVISLRVKRAEAGRKGGVASGKARSKPGSKREASASVGVRESLNPRPDPSPTASNEAVTPPATPGPPKGSKGTRLPEDFTVTPEMAAWAREKAPSCGSADHEEFCDYWRGVPGAKGRKTDWVATWRNWMRRNHERRAARQPRTASNGQRRSTADDRIADIQALKLNPPAGPTAGARPLNLIQGELA